MGMEQYKPNLGEIPGEDARRDAVHIAVAPVVAGEMLLVGERVGLREDGKAVQESEDAKAIGIVDPFLIESIGEGQRFWLFLFPGTITDLRHVWSHPAFKARLQEKP